ncbi:MAG: LysR family transcriptional regulator [Evtepia gabavorous]
MNIDHLRYFLVLSQEMHYSRAAQRLNISQSGLSHAIAALEQELGVSLFQKSGRGIALGRYGAALLSQAQQIVALADSCLRHFQMLREGVGTLRLQTIPLLIIPTVTRLCRQFKQANPGCDFEFSTGMSSQVCQSVIQGKADIGFCSKILPDPQLVYAAIQRRAMVAAVPLDHPLARQDTVTLEETLPYPHVTYSWLSGQRDPVDRLFAPVRDRWHIAYQVEDANFILELVAQGFGITVLLDTPPVHRPDVKVLPSPTRCRRVTSTSSAEAPLTPWAAWSGFSIFAWRNPRRKQILLFNNFLSHKNSRLERIPNGCF